MAITDIPARNRSRLAATRCWLDQAVRSCRTGRELRLRCCLGVVSDLLSGQPELKDSGQSSCGAWGWQEARPLPPTASSARRRNELRIDGDASHDVTDVVDPGPGECESGEKIARCPDAFVEDGGCREALFDE